MDHPLTQERIDYVRDHVERSPYSNIPDPPAYVEMLQRIKVKVAAFTEPPSTTLGEIFGAGPIGSCALCPRDRVLPDPRSRPGTAGDRRADPRLSARPLFPRAQGSDAVRKRANRRSGAALRGRDAADPNAPLLRIELAQVYVENNDPAQNKRAIAYLSDALRTEDKDVDGWHLLATAYGRDNQMGMAALSLAEEGLAADNKKNAVQQADSRRAPAAEKRRRLGERAANSPASQRTRRCGLSRERPRPSSRIPPPLSRDQRS